MLDPDESHRSEVVIDSSFFRHAKLQKYINMMTIMTNCLTSKGIVHELLDPA